MSRYWLSVSSLPAATQHAILSLPALQPQWKGVVEWFKYSTAEQDPDSWMPATPEEAAAALREAADKPDVSANICIRLTRTATAIQTGRWRGGLER